MRVQVVGSCRFSLLVLEKLLEYEYKEICFNLLTSNTESNLTINDINFESPHFSCFSSKTVSEENLTGFDLILDCAFNIDLSLEINHICRRLSKGYIKGQRFGGVLFSFIDFGENFTTFEKVPNEDIEPGFITSVTRHPEKETVLVIGFDTSYSSVRGYSFDGHENFVTFSGIRGQVGDIINDISEPFELTEYFGPDSSGKLERKKGRYLIDTKVEMEEEVEYLGCGVMIQKKKPISSSFKSLEKYLDSKNEEIDSMVPLNMKDFGLSKHLFICISAYYNFQQSYGRSPTQKDEKLFISSAREINAKLYEEDVDIEVIKTFLKNTEGENNVLLSEYFSSMLVQEAIKYTGFGSTHHQASILDFNSVLSSSKELNKKRILLFGSDEGVPEWLKQLSLLNKQNLFESEVILVFSEKITELPESDNVTVEQIIIDFEEINSDIQLSYLIDWNTIDVVVSLLNNKRLNRIIDTECVLYIKPCIFVTTHGSKLNIQSVIPYKTITYSELPEVEDYGVNIPTLMNCFHRFIYNHLGCCAKAEYEVQERVRNTELMKFTKNPKKYLADWKQKNYSNCVYDLDSLQDLNRILRLERTFETMIVESFNYFHRIFRDVPLYLQKNKDREAKNEYNEYFWNEQFRRYPKVIRFSSSSPSHIRSILLLANMYSLIYGVFKGIDEFIWDIDLAKRILSKVRTPGVSNVFFGLEKDSELVESKDKQDKAELYKTDAIKEELDMLEEFLDDEDGYSILANIQTDLKLTSLELYHELVYSLTQLYTEMYSLEEISFERYLGLSKLVKPSNKSTESAAISLSLLSLEKSFEDEDDFLDFNSNFHSQFHLSIESQVCSKAKKKHDVVLLTDVNPLPDGFTKWDQFVIEGKNLTLDGFLKQFEKQTEEIFGKKLSIEMLLHPNANIHSAKGYSRFLFCLDTPEHKEKLEVDLVDLIKEIYGDNVCRSNIVPLECQIIKIETDEYYEVPQLIYKF